MHYHLCGSGQIVLSYDSYTVPSLGFLVTETPRKSIAFYSFKVYGTPVKLDLRNYQEWEELSLFNWGEFWTKISQQGQSWTAEATEILWFSIPIF